MRTRDHEVEIRVIVQLDRNEIGPGDDVIGEARKIIESLGGVEILDAHELLL